MKYFFILFILFFSQMAFSETTQCMATVQEVKQHVNSFSEKTFQTQNELFRLHIQLKKLEDEVKRLRVEIKNTARSLQAERNRFFTEVNALLENAQ